jgi:predicted HicB family RNase H-like nuclease
MAQKGHKKSKLPYDINKYTYSVIWSEEDHCFLASAAEFGNIARHGETPEEALKLIKEALAFEIECILKDKREPVPAPFSLQNFSGKLVVRMPKDLHRQLAIEAARQGTSLNQWINAKLSSYEK